MAKSSDDRQLVQRCGRELPYDTRAFAELVRRHEARIFRLCAAIVGTAEADDASQEVFLRAFSALPKLRDGSSFRGWLYRIATNVCRTRLARSTRRLERQTEYWMREGGVSERATEPLDLDGEFEGPVADALGELKGTDREVLLLRFVGDLNLEELAAATDSKLSATKMRLYRAVDRFRGAFERAQRADEM